MISVKALGTNGWFDSDTGQTMCTLIQSEDFDIILDAGFGIRKIKGLVDVSRPIYLFLSHLHYDHTVGLHTLEIYHFEKPLTVIVPEGQKDAFLRMGNAPYSSDWTRCLPAGIRIFESNEIDTIGLPFKVEALPLRHTVPDVGFRFEIDGKVIAYLTDTGYCDNAVTLAKNADLAIAECGALPGTAKPNWPHMEPAIDAKLAVEANVKLMLLTHFGAGDYTSLKMRYDAVKSARNIFPYLITGVDDLEVAI